MNRTLYTFSFILLLLSFTASAQQILPIAFDLAAPIDVNLDADGNPWVTQSGSGMNDGLVQKIHPDGTKETIIEGLPSYFDFMSNELQGALSTQVMADGRIFVCQGGGPDSLSASIMEFHWDDYVAKGAPLTPADRRSIVKSGEWALANGFDESNPYSFVFDQEGNFLISDAAANAIIKYEVATGTFSALTVFPPFPNPTPIGPPVVQVVPTKIIAHPDGGYLVSSLTGFPFLDGASKIYRVMDDGTTSDYAAGLTLVTDLEFDPNDGNLVAMQFAKFGPVDTTFGFVFGSAQLVKVHPDGSLDTLLAGFGPSPGLAISANGTAYMSHLFLGQLLRTDVLSGLLDFQLPSAKPLQVFPNPSDGRLRANLTLARAGEVTWRLTDLMGRTVASGNAGLLPAGEQEIGFDFTNENTGHGVYQLSLVGGGSVFAARVLLP